MTAAACSVGGVVGWRRRWIGRLAASEGAGGGGGCGRTRSYGDPIGEENYARQQTEKKRRKNREMENPRSWIAGDETAAAALGRAQQRRPLLVLPPPLHRTSLRAGNVVELAGPSPSAKSHVLLEAAIYSVLPKVLGGLEKIVLYFDLDCRFDVLRFAHLLKSRIAAILQEGLLNYEDFDTEHENVDNTLFEASMRRLLYTRCYSTDEFLAALKTIQCQPLHEVETLGVNIQIMMIDSVGAFYWIDRAHQTLLSGENKRRKLSLQSLTEAVVEEIRKIVQLHPVLILAAKAMIFGPTTGSSQNGTHRYASKWSSENNALVNRMSTENFLFREYMPSVWQSFVTHRIHLLRSDRFNEHGGGTDGEIYMSKWFQPALNILDKFVIDEDNGIIMLQ